MEQELRDRIVELNKQREDFVAQANAQVNAFGGAIAELERLLESFQKPEEEGADEEE